jgi:hypothetical protein
MTITPAAVRSRLAGPVEETRMQQLIFHIGMPKTGTTSIQDSLFWNLRDPRYRFISLDTVFGNQLIGALFCSTFHKSYFRALLSAEQLSRFRTRAQDYLHRSLLAARQDGVTPVISAELAWRLEESDFEQLRQFLAERGYQARVVCYIRPPLDQLESSYQQHVKVKQPAPLDFWTTRRGWRDAVDSLRRVFGEEHVSFHLFQPAAFPGRCVVQHFCQVAGVDFPASDVRHENDSLNLNALRFLHAVNLAGRSHTIRAWSQLQRHVLVRRLKSLPGPPLRFHPALTAPFVEHMTPDIEWLEPRVGFRIPWTLVSRDPDAGIRSEADLLDFAPDALDWLARESGSRPIRPGSREATVEQVVRQLGRLAPHRFPRTAASGLAHELRVRARRQRLVTKAMGST